MKNNQNGSSNEEKSSEQAKKIVEDSLKNQSMHILLGCIIRQGLLKEEN